MKLRKYEDETLVKVLTPMGIACGSFTWPSKDLSMLEMLNKSKRGYYFRHYEKEVIKNE